MAWPLWRRNKDLLGIDLGTGQIKAVAMKGKWLLVRGVSQVPPAGLSNENEIAAALAEAVQETGWRGRRAVSAIDGERVIVRYLRLPRMSEKELRSGLRYEAERYLPLGTQDMVLDCAILDPEPASLTGQMLVLLAAAPRELTLTYHRIFREAGLELVALDIVPAALCRALAAETEGREAIVLDLGASSSQVVLMRGGRLLYSRRINTSVVMPPQEDTPPGFNLLFNLPQEVRRSLEFYRSQVGGGFNPSKLYLTGGGSYQEGLRDFLHMELDLPVEVSRPYGLGPEFAVAAGLALRESGG